MARQSQTVPPGVFMPPKDMSSPLLNLFLRTGYNITRRHGQRHFGPPLHWIGAPPDKGSEVFVGRIPHDCFEDELVPVFESIATLYEIRLMLHFSGYNRSYAFITYCNSNDADRAIAVLNKYEIRPGHKIVVMRSDEKNRIYVGGIPFNMKKEEVWEKVVKLCKNVKNLTMYPNPKNEAFNRGFFFVEFQDHYSAALAKGALSQLCKKKLEIEWAVPEPEVNPVVLATITKLFIRKVPPILKTADIRRFLQDVIPRKSIQRVYLSGNYCFIHLETRDHAQLAKDKLSMVMVNGERLEVHWARPKSFKKVMPSNGRSRQMQTFVVPPPPGNIRTQATGTSRNGTSSSATNRSSN